MSKLIRRSYSETEEEFLKSCVKIGLEHNLTNTQIAKSVYQLLRRTQKAIELKLSLLKQEYNEEMGFHEIMKEDEIKHLIREKQSKVTSSIVQQIKPENAHDHLEPLGPKDVGKRVLVKVYNVKPYGAFCETEDGKTGLVIRSLISTDFVDDISDYLQVGDQFEAIIVPDKQNKDRVLLNAKAVGNILSIEERERLKLRS